MKLIDFVKLKINEDTQMFKHESFERSKLSVLEYYFLVIGIGVELEEVLEYMKRSLTKKEEKIVSKINDEYFKNPLYKREKIEEHAIALNEEFFWYERLSKNKELYIKIVEDREKVKSENNIKQLEDWKRYLNDFEGIEPLTGKEFKKIRNKTYLKCEKSYIMLGKNKTKNSFYPFSTKYSILSEIESNDVILNSDWFEGLKEFYIKARDLNSNEENIKKYNEYQLKENDAFIKKMNKYFKIIL